jgi:16S rRNA (guanine966-N2)-methyltransferase
MSQPNLPRNQIRIIAGTHRGRRIDFPAESTIRPTKSIARETLFNWLSNDIVGSECVDLFAGSGALSFEALSRGARSVIAVERDPTYSEAIRITAKKLDLGIVVQMGLAEEAMKMIATDRYGIYFLDPPFNYEVDNIIKLLSFKLSDQALVYIERDKFFFDKEIDQILDQVTINQFELYKSRTFAGVTCALLRNRV